MDFYKKMVKPKDPNGVLSEKEYKCASLQAIINEAIKENNKRHLRDLVEEVNEHLADLRAIKNDVKNQDKCNKIIKQLEDCLIKIANQNDVFHDVMATIQAQLQELQNLTNRAIRDESLDELKRLAERMEGNIAIVKEIPEVKGAISGDNRNEKVLEVVNQYTSLLNKALEHINRQSKVISAPIPVEDILNKSEVQSPFKQNKVALNEVEEKLKLMRQKRLDRLSTFVDQQSKLSGERIKENATDHGAKITEKIGNERLESVEMSEPERGSFKVEKVRETGATSNFGKGVRHELLAHPEKVQKEKTFGKNSSSDVKPGFVSGLRNSFGKGPVSGSTAKSGNSVRPREPAPPPPLNNYKTTPEKPMRQILEETQGNTPNIREISRNSVVTKSFAERQIEHAKNQNASKLTPPRTPTNIKKKFFNSINCVLGSSSKSIEDLPDEFKSPFERELKNVHLKSASRLEHKEKDNLLVEDAGAKVRRSSSDRSQEKSEQTIKTLTRDEIPPLLPLRKNKIPLERPVIPIEKSTSQCHLVSKPRANKGEVSAEEAIRKKVWRTSLDFDTVMIRRAEPIEECTITIKRDSNNTIEPTTERCSFTSFKSTTDNSIENPLYELIDNLNPAPAIRRKDSLHLDNLLLSAKTSSSSNVLDLVHDENHRKLRRSSSILRKDSQSSVIPNKFLITEPIISKLEQAILYFRGLKRDDDYFWLDKLLSKYYVKVDEIETKTAFDQIEKNNLLERLRKANKNLEVKVNHNEDMLKKVFQEQVEILGKKYMIK
ncbi:uncharacterized protein LOC126738277 [Anthonomus grandis grandis]|uniref:uncharacterized protein LOC126738277 n=1 Tax=Anthonomus grandis grandis TaxID=2921223 RepID=UPI0021664617|nr:uncharacterized protein LOC126738277 [Anthonomus grandis grandis]